MAADDHHSNVSNAKHGKTTAAGAISPNATKKPKERVPVKPELTEINQYLMCPLCSGYFIDATAIIECQHTFCKSCILKYLETNSYCPICDVQLNNAKPHMSLRSDVIVQRLVYKLIPGSLVSELRRRRDFAVLKCDSDGVEAAEMVSNGMALEVEAATDLSTILSLEDVVSLSIEYFRSCDGEDTVPKEQLVHKKQEQQPTTNTQDFQDIKTSVCHHEEANDRSEDRRYLQCPAAVSVGLLKKFIRMKYGLSDDYRVDLLYNGDRDNILENDLTLLDVAFIFKWNKDEPMRFHYRIFDRTAKSIVTRSGTKRSAPPSMMDEPPDDDATSGPHNRSSMTSASPSSKLPRLSGNSTGANSNAGSTQVSKSTSRTTSTSAFATLAYDFCEEGNSAETDKLKKGKYRGIHRKTSNISNSNSNLGKSSSQGLKRSPSSLRSHLSRSQSQSDEAGKAACEAGIANASRRSMSTNTSGLRIGRSNSVGNSGNDIKSEERDSTDSLEVEGVGSDGSKNSDRTVTNSNRLRSASQQVIQSQQMNGSLKFSISTALGKNNPSDEKREPSKISLGHISSKSPERKHKHRHHKIKNKEKTKALKFTFPLNQNLNQSNANQSINQNQSHKSSGKEAKINAGKVQTNSEFGNRKVVDGKGNGNVSGGSNNNSQTCTIPNSVKSATSAHLSNISKSISVSIGVNVQSSNNVGNNMTNNSSTQNSNKGNQYGNKNISSAGLLPKNTGIEIQSTTISQCLNNSQQTSNSHSSMVNNHQSASRSHPLLPDSVHVPKSVTLIPVNPNAMSNPGSVVSGRGNSSGNLSEKSSSGTSNRLNAHTFTHPITNKSLHQITVTEVPPPPKSGRSSPANNAGGNSGSANTGSNSSNAGSGCNPIEKVIANAVANKPQFNGPGSMEITKIYCGTKETPTKKLKERKGLDISISVPGMNVNMKDKCKSTQKLEETLRQKMGMGNSATSVMLNNKVKGVSQAPTTILNAKMPPGITIGPVAGMNKSSLNPPNNNNQQNTNTSNTIKDLGFTLPPHITAHPQLPPGGIRNITGNQSKPTDKNTNRSTTKDVVVPNSVNKTNTPSIPEPLVNGKTNNVKGQINHNIQSRKQLGEALASMFDMASRNVMKSPSPPKNSQAKDKGQIPSSFTSNQSNRDGSSSNCDKRPLDMSSSNRKKSRESPEPKRPRGIESSGSKTSSTHEIPLDLSGRSSRPSSANSNSSSPGLGTSKSNHSSPTEKLKINDSHNSTNVNTNTKCIPIPIPKISPTAQANSGNFSLSPNAKLNQESLKNSLKSLVTSSAGSQTATPSILSIAQSLAQKQLQQQQQQQQQNLHNQIMQLHHGLQSMHANPNLSNQGKSGGTGLKGIGSGGHNNGNLNLLGSSTSNSMGLSSLSPPIIPMPNPSPPGTGFEPLRNLLTLSDVALRHGKLHPMNNLMAAAGICPPPPQPHSHAMSLAGSPSAVTTAGMFSHLPQHLVNSLGPKSSTGILDPGSHAHLFGNLAALSAAHNERLAAAAGMNHHFGGSLSPPLSLTNSFYSQQIRPPSSSPHGSLRIPTVTPKSNSSNNSKKGSTPPLSFSHPPPHSSNNSSTKSPTSPLTANLPVFSSNSSSPITNVTYSSKSSDSSSTASKNIKINGSLSNTFPLLPPGIHNPLMPTNRSLSGMNSSSNGNKNSITSSIMNMTTKPTNSDKKGIPNSMKISNFLPSKSKDGKVGDSSNVEATITSGSNVGVGGTSLTKFLNSISPVIVSQSHPNLLVSSPPKDSSSRLLHSPTKSRNTQECMNVFTSSSTMRSSTSTSQSDNVDTNTKTPLMTSIKHEPESSSNSSCSGNTSSSRDDPIPQMKTIISPTPKATSEAISTKDAVKPNSCEIKSEEGGLTTESCSGRVMGHTVGVLGISNISPPLSSGRATQPQNRAVRHIPNPSLLFNRQNSNISNQIGSLIAPLPTTNTNASSPVKCISEEPNSIPFSQKSSIKLDEHPLQVSAILFPGVSVPVQVKFDSEPLLSIPIPTVNPINPNTKIIEDQKSVHMQAVKASDEHEIEVETEMMPTNSDNKVVKCLTETLPVITELDANIISKDISKESITEIKIKLNSNDILIPGEVQQIIEKESMEDAEQDIDIDVGTEMGPIFSDEDPIENINEVEYTTHEDAVEEKISPEIPKIQAISVAKECINPKKIIEVETDKTHQVEEVVVDVIEASILAVETTSQIKPEEVIEKPQQEILDHDHMEIDTENEAPEKIVKTNMESKKEVSEVEGNQEILDEIEADVDVRMDEPMEVNIDEVLEPQDNEFEKKVQQDFMPMESSVEENTESEMEIVEATEFMGEIDPIILQEDGLPILSEADTDMPMEKDISDKIAISQDFNDISQKSMEIKAEEECKKSETASENNAIHITQEDANLVSTATKTFVDMVGEIVQNVEMEQVNALKEDEAVSVILSVKEEASDLIQKDLPCPSQPVVESQAEEDKNCISHSDSNTISNQIIINLQPEAIQVEEEKVENIVESIDEAAECKESAEESINALNEPEAVESVKSPSQLEVDCPPVATGMEVSIKVNSENSSHDNIVLESDEKEKSEMDIELECQNFPPISKVENEVKSQNIINSEDKSTDSILTEEKAEETPTETCLSDADPNATTIPHICINDSIPIQNSLETSETKEETPKADLSMELISATATITTTKTSDISNKTTNTVEIEVDITESSLSRPISKNPLESQASQILHSTNKLKNMETLEKVAAGFLASAANSINNNNNTSLTTMATPTCDITITTTNN